MILNNAHSPWNLATAEDASRSSEAIRQFLSHQIRYYSEQSVALGRM